MKTMIISDIHGYSKNLKKVLDVFYKEGCKRLIILGDLLTPGSNYEEVKNILNNFKFSLLCMKGNNDGYIFSELDFNIIDGYLNIKPCIPKTWKNFEIHYKYLLSFVLMEECPYY